ncbi:toll/interleukin-1 receptor domain-containing protein [Algoriphagus mannitolivorans]|uniref:toll/interleukin-1 receptor domain-containing protein n=1 Tax=Algoriphagus mannitolivorans TaxID=226504 RepID=UPI000405C12C|nr:toll/interleukin-1 receptor domain-containing protein [Algoriphagus mannitolivorans]
MEKDKIFISHRHSDTQSDCHRIKSDLQKIFGKDQVFLDIENLEPGIRFAEAIERTLAQSKVVLVVIGPDWLDVTNEKGEKRLFDPKDWVRREIAASLNSSGTRVIPVLVKNAEIPKEEDLPDDLKALTQLQVAEITTKRWDYDLGELVKVLEKLIPKKNPEPQPSPKPRPIPPQPPKSWWQKNYLWVLGGFVGFIILVGMCIPNEDEVLPYDDQSYMSTEEMVDAQENNPQGTEIYDNLTLQEEDDNQAINLQGRWTGVNDLGITYYYEFFQNGNSLTFNEISFEGSIIGNGKGSINGEFINLEYQSAFNYSGTVNLRVSPNADQLTGQVSVPSQGVSAAMTLNRNY